MSKRDQLLRLMHIHNILKSRKSGANYEEIRNHLEQKHYQDGGYDNDLACSQKTLKKDCQLLWELFRIEIKFKRSTMTYQIIEDGFSDHSQTIFDNLLLANAYKQSENNFEIMIFKKRKSRGLENLNGILHAIQKQKTITFNYTKHWEV
jgi:predicted DNA-binding transcriptional regulator YafY